MSGRNIRITRNDLIALFAGALAPLAFSPVAFFPLLLLSLAMLFNLWLRQNPTEAIRSGIYYGLGYFGVGVSWVYVVIHESAHTAAPIAAFLTLLFVIVLSLYLGLTGYLITKIRSRMDLKPANPWFIALIIPTVWVLIEWLRGWLFTGFPWLSLGYSHIDSVLSGWGSVLGVYGLSWFAAITAAVIILIRQGHQRHFMVWAVLLIWVSGWGLQQVQWTDAIGDELNVALVQGNVPQATKWDPEQVKNRLNRYADLTRPLFAEHQLIVWPENAITVFYHRIKDSYFKVLNEMLDKTGSALIVGIPVQKEDGSGYYTSMILPEHPQQMYHKRHLVPFGEYLPLEWLRGLIEFFDLPMSRFSAGDDEQRPLEVAGVVAAMSICYEDAFASELLTQLPQATVLINGSNNAWFGDSFAPHQHLQIARMRSLEMQRPTLRAATNGISAIIDSHGEITQRSQQFVAAVVKGKIQPRQGVTPYILFGNYLIITLMLAVLMTTVYLLQRQKSKP